jgi:hypothetical protein
MLVAALVLLVACERTTPTPAPTSKTTAPAPTDKNDALAVEIRAALTDFAAYSERMIAIVRKHGANCDEAATKLAELEPVFAELMPRLAALKEKLSALPAPEQERLKHEGDDMMAAFQKRNPDLDAIEERSKQCEQTSAAFAAIAKKVAFKKKQ